MSSHRQPARVESAEGSESDVKGTNSPLDPMPEIVPRHTLMSKEAPAAGSERTLRARNSTVAPLDPAPRRRGTPSTRTAGVACVDTSTLEALRTAPKTRERSSVTLKVPHERGFGRVRIPLGVLYFYAC